LLPMRMNAHSSTVEEKQLSIKEEKMKKTFISIVLLLLFFESTLKIYAIYKVGIVDQEIILLNSKRGKEIVSKINSYKAQNPTISDFRRFKNKQYDIIRNEVLKIISNIGKSEGFTAIVQIDNQIVYEDENIRLTKMDIAKIDKIDLTQRVIE